ncbi:MAG: hypothetical protein J0I06_17040 [Planctomycetes bacterium]|nr:hypothetical protein [Planctomycetota bacterium]
MPGRRGQLARTGERPTSVRVVPPPVEQAVWHYSANGAKRGPVTTTQPKSLVEP